MFSLSTDSKRKKEPELLQNVSDGLKRLYRTKLLPLEEAYRFHDFHSPALEDADFDNKPMVLLVGQYSTGKTTFIRHLMEQDFPGMRIGPEPTTDSFIAVMHGEQEGVVPGNALVVDPKKPFRKLNAFGNAFLNRAQRRHTAIDEQPHGKLVLGVDGGFDIDDLIKVYVRSASQSGPGKHQHNRHAGNSVRREAEAQPR
ncbi:EH domain-containing protein 1 [Acipenser ruthenus]|uniref:EH domain-containing protein 1 n=1 Tax=Acipenser ruthenus TaxID=7906 RepID=A0A444U4P5_ACIRT|nr:EH domain-containing protein 1 [Acipenser ruthenus]